MENKLSWFDRVMTPKTKAYKDFENEIKNTAPEFFFRDGERKFSDQQKRFIQIYKTKESQMIEGSAFTINTIFDSDTSVKTNYKNFVDVIKFVNKQKIDNRILIIQNNIDFTEVNINNEASKQKFLSDCWAKELESRTDLSMGMTNTEIDEKQANHYRKYEFYDKAQTEKIGAISIYDFNGEIGETMTYTCDADYLNALKNELEANMGGFKYETLVKSPELLKKVDDLIYDAYGEENPNSIDFYLEKSRVIDKDSNGIQNETVEIDERPIPEDIKAFYRERNYEFLADKFSSLKEIEHKINDLENLLKNINNQNPKIMETQKEFDQVKYLKDQLKYLGFGEDEKLHKDLEKGINSKKQEFEIKTSSDKTLPENNVDFTLKFNKTDRGGIFLNSYHAKMTNDNKEEISHNFPVNMDNTFTAKEAINLLEGRSVKIEFLNPKNNEIEPAFVKFNFNESKTEKGNYYFQNFYKNYGVDTAKIVEKSNLVFDNPEWKENSIKSLEKGNIVKVKFKENDQVIEGKAILDPQNRKLKLYDNDMNRLNTNKPLEGLEQDHKHDKANAREQSIKR